ncbi:MAG: SDR family oxidoreductase [Candidatus Zixiibacteriota bacterium]|nr:MAG: SDR family oxidoreductase [candidate division Zixibacteria bacterium]
MTGASAGLGFASAMALAAEGANLIVNSRDEARIARAASQIADVTGVKVKHVAADIATVEGLQRLDEVIASPDQQPIDILVSNAGGPPPGLFLDHDDAAWDNAHRLVLKSAIGLTRLVLPRMIERRFGRLIYLTSVGVLQPVDNLILSNTYRAAVTGMCKTISNTYAQYGITANCVCPGYTRTERLTQLAQARAEQSGESADEVLAAFAELAPVRRLGEAAETGAVVAFLASEQAAFITGASIPVDGGRHQSLL